MAESLGSISYGKGGLGGLTDSIMAEPLHPSFQLWPNGYTKVDFCVILSAWEHGSLEADENENLGY